MTWEFSGKVALVTGAGSGIGRASAQASANAGARIGVGPWSEQAEEEAHRLRSVQSNGAS